MSAEIVTIVAGQNLYKKGDTPNSCFILQKGSVHILNETGQKVACLLYTSPSPRD